MEVLAGALGLLLVGAATFAFLEIQDLKRSQDLLQSNLDSTNEKLDSELLPIVKESTSTMEVLATVLGDQNRRLNTVTKQLNAVSESLLKKEDKKTLSVNEALERLGSLKRKEVKKSVKTTNKVLKTALVDKASVKASSKAGK